MLNLCDIYQDHISRRILTAHYRNNVKFEIKKSLWDSTPQIPVYRRDFMLCSWTICSLLLCVCHCCPKRKTETTSKKPCWRCCRPPTHRPCLILQHYIFLFLSSLSSLIEISFTFIEAQKCLYLIDCLKILFFNYFFSGNLLKFEGKNTT